jgi:hypothetical protein
MSSVREGRVSRLQQARDAAIAAAAGSKKKRGATVKKKAAAAQQPAPAEDEAAMDTTGPGEELVAVVETAEQRKLRKAQEQLKARDELIERLLAEQHAAEAAAAAAVEPAGESSRFARKEPRAQDLREYDGAAGNKLDAWLDELGAAIDLYELNGREATRFAVSRLRDAACQWWNALGAAGQAPIHDAKALAAALRGRFQPITSERVAREQLRSLQQGSRSVNEYISDFQRLCALLPDMSAADTLFSFESGLAAHLAEKLRIHGVSTLQEAIAMAARVGGLMQGGATPKSSLHMMESDDAAAAMEERISRAVTERLYAMQAGSGMGAKTQTQIGYQGQHQRGGRGGARGGFRGGSRFPPPVVPGVSEQVVRQRMEAQQCVRCGVEGHRSPGCPNSIRGLGN